MKRTVSSFFAVALTIILITTVAAQTPPTKHAWATFPRTNGNIESIQRSSEDQTVASITLNEGERALYSAVIDSINGFAYFGTATWPGRIVKVRLSDFTRVAALTLGRDEDNAHAGAIDPTSGFAYFGTMNSPGRIVKIRLSDFTEAAALTLNSGEDNISSAVLDTAKGFGYFGTSTSPGLIVKVRLSDLTRVGALRLNQVANDVSSGVIDPDSGYAYFGTSTVYSSGTALPGVIARVRLSDFTHADSRSLDWPKTTGEGYRSAVIDTAKGFAYFGTLGNAGRAPASIVKIRLSDFSVAGSLVLDQNEIALQSAVIDPSNDLAYFGACGMIVRVALSSFSRVGVTYPGVNGCYISGVVDVINRYAYFGTDTDPGIIVKMRTEGAVSTSVQQTVAPSTFTSVQPPQAETVSNPQWMYLVTFVVVALVVLVPAAYVASKRTRKPSPIAEVKPAGLFDISVTVPSVGKTVTLEVASDHTMKSLVDTIVSTLDLPKDRTYRVEHAGEHINLPDFGKSLGTLGIREGSKLTLRVVE